MMENIWITFELKGRFHIGIVLREDGELFVSSVDEYGTASYVPYEKVTAVRRLKILRRNETENRTDKPGIEYKFSDN